MFRRTPCIMNKVWNLVFTNLKVHIPISLQPEDVNLCEFLNFVLEFKGDISFFYVFKCLGIL